MNSLGNLIVALQGNFSPAAVVSLLFGLAAVLGLLLGVSLMGLIAASRKRRSLRAIKEERELLVKSLQDSKAYAVRLQAEKDSLAAKHNGFDALIVRQKSHIGLLTKKLSAAEKLAAEEKAARQAEVIRQKERAARQEKEAQQGASKELNAIPFDAKAPPTLIKRVPSSDERSSNAMGTGIIPDDQVIPVLPEAELTANVEAYDLSDLEDLIGQDS